MMMNIDLNTNKKKATREAYGAELVKLGAERSDIVVLDADLAGATKTQMFKKAYPDRFFDCGIAEENMMGIAAGLSTCGFVPFASSFAMFAAGRAFEQVRNSIGYPHLNVKIGATHAGISVGEDGATHQCCEDMALMRSIPGMTVVCPSDEVSAAAAVRAAADYKGPVYLRFGRAATPTFYEQSGFQFELGKGIELSSGNDIAIIACGMLVYPSLIAAQMLKEEGIEATVIDMHTIKPLDDELVIEVAKRTGAVLCAEEHNVIGGLGDAVCALLSRYCPTPVYKLGINDVFGHSGSASGLLEEFSLDYKGVYNSAKKFLASL